MQVQRVFLLWLMFMFLSLQCLPIHGHGFVLDKYKCHCKKGFYHPNRVAVNGFTGKSQRINHLSQS